MSNKIEIFETTTEDGKKIYLSDMIKEFRRYSNNHPLRITSYQIFDNEGNIIEDNVGNYCNILNSYNSICSALHVLYQRDIEVYKDFVLNKLKAEDSRNGYNKQRLISAIAEIVIIFNFTNFAGWTEFKYENKISDKSSKNVDFSITYPEHKFHIEIKTFDLENRHKKLANFKADGDPFIEINHKLSNSSFKITQEIFKGRIVHSVNDRVEKFVKEAIGKYPSTKQTNESNVLLFNYNENIDQINACLIKRGAECLDNLNSSSTLDFVVSTSLYSRIEYFLEVLKKPSLIMLPQHSPFYMHFCIWSIVVANKLKKNSEEHELLSRVCFNATTYTPSMVNAIPECYIHKGDFRCYGKLSNDETT